jgi:hypothetical protein
MGTAPVLVAAPLVDHGRFPAERTGRDSRSDRIRAHPFSPRGRSG